MSINWKPNGWHETSWISFWHNVFTSYSFIKNFALENYVGKRENSNFSYSQNVFKRLCSLCKKGQWIRWFLLVSGSNKLQFSIPVSKQNYNVFLNLSGRKLYKTFSPFPISFSTWAMATIAFKGQQNCLQFSIIWLTPPKTTNVRLFQTDRV